MEDKLITIEEAKGIVARVDDSPCALGEKIAYLTGYLIGAKGRLSPEAENYLLWVKVCFDIICNGGVIANVPVRARGRFDFMPYRALDLIPAGTSQHVEE